MWARANHFVFSITIDLTFSPAAPNCVAEVIGLLREVLARGYAHLYRGSLDHNLFGWREGGESWRGILRRQLKLGLFVSSVAFLDGATSCVEISFHLLNVSSSNQRHHHYVARRP